MPGRVSARTSAASRMSRKSSVPTLNSRSSTASIPDEGPSTDLRVKICAIFGDAQKSMAGHRKLVVSLRKIQESCCYEPQKPGKGNLDEFDENDFNIELARCIVRILPIKKTEPVGDRIIKFLGQFLKHAGEKDAALIPEQELSEDQGLPETPTSRLISYMFSVLVPILTCKEKTVRYRATQIISYTVNCLDSLDDESYELVKAGLAKRVKDKEAMVRVQAALGLGRLAGNDGEDEDDGEDSDDEAAGLLNKLLNSLQNDPSADVRRSLLLNLPLTPATLPYLLERARDLDGPTRRALYSRLLPALGDFRHLSLSMREKLLRWGLRDRDEYVRKATARLFRERWIEDCAGVRDAEGNRPAELPPPNIDALLELLERIDVVNSGVETGIALEAMKEFWDGRPDYREAVTFDDAFWDDLTSESVFLARSLNDFCRQEEDGRYESIIEEKLPEVTKLGFFLQRYLNVLIEKIRSNTKSKEAEAEQDTVEQEFIVEQLLYIVKTLDYSDEVGRRTMFSLLRETLAVPELPEEITKLVSETLRLVCGPDSAGEREFCGIVLEAIAEIHDTIAAPEPSVNGDADDSFHSAKSEMTESTATGSTASKKLLSETPELDEEKAIKEIMVNMKCLHIAQCMLQNVGDNLKENIHLVTMLNNLVVPAVRSHEAPIRERGLVCLGLCCLLDKTLAEENLTLFIHCFSKGHAALQTTALHILSDILSTHPSVLTSPPTPATDQSHSQEPPSSPSKSSPTSFSTNALHKPLSKVFARALKASHTPDVQAAATVALCKLLLTRTLTDADLLRHLVTTFFEPTTRDNAAARQALSYFLPVFAHSRRENMQLLASVVPGTMHAVVGLEDELDDDEDVVVGAAAVGAMLVDWTDARKLVVLNDDAGDEVGMVWDEAGKREKEKEKLGPNGDVHLDLATAIFERVLGQQGGACSKEEKKALLGMVGKMYVTANSDGEKLRAVLELAREVGESKAVAEAVSRNAVAKLVAGVEKAIAVQERGEKEKGRGRGRKSKMPDVEAGESQEREKGSEKLKEKRGASASAEATSIEATLVGDESVLKSEEPAEVTEVRVDADGDTMMED